MGSLHVLEGTMNAEMYINVLEQHMLHSRRRVFQQDNAKPHIRIAQIPIEKTGIANSNSKLKICSMKTRTSHKNTGCKKVFYTHMRWFFRQSEKGNISKTVMETVFRIYMSLFACKSRRGNIEV